MDGLLHPVCGMLSCKQLLLAFSSLQDGRRGTSMVPGAGSADGAEVLCLGGSTPLLQCAGAAGAAPSTLLPLACLLAA